MGGYFVTLNIANGYVISATKIPDKKDIFAVAMTSLNQRFRLFRYHIEL